MGGFEVGSSVSLRALHRLPVEGPEGELHAHDYRLEVEVSRHELNENGMVCDLDLLNAALKAVVDQFSDQDLDSMRPEWAQSVTVEVLAKWIHELLARPIREADGEEMKVRVWESTREFGAYHAPV